ncbi:MAG TPA: hypothetical protein PKX93_05530 [bacterium]|nr:hypothetical protein [bacterium]
MTVRKKTEKGAKESRQAEEKGRPESLKPTEVRINIRCRHCFIVDGYTRQEDRCRHCGARLFLIDEV